VNTVFTKLKDFVGIGESEDYEYDYPDVDSPEYATYSDEPAPAPEPEERPRRRSRVADATRTTSAAVSATTPRNNVIGMPGVNNGPFEVIVIEPRSFEKMPQVIQALRERKSVVLNLTLMDPEEAQRAVDFVAGATYAIDGHQERVGESIFLFTPNCVQVTTQTGVVHDVNNMPTQRDPLNPVAAPSAPSWPAEIQPLAQ